MSLKSRNFPSKNFFFTVIVGPSICQFNHFLILVLFDWSIFGGLNVVVVRVADCYPKCAGFDSRGNAWGKRKRVEDKPTSENFSCV
jgi:hypothetical protein